MEGHSHQAIIIQSLTSSLQTIVAEVAQIKSEVLCKLSNLAEQSVSVQRMVESMGSRLSKIECCSEEDSVRTPETLLNRRKLETEIKLLKEKVKVLAAENVMLRGGKQRPLFAARQPLFDPSISDDNHSMSSIQLVERSERDKAAVARQRIREFRLDSAPSQSFKPNSSLLSDPRISKIINVEPSIQKVASTKTGKIVEFEQKLKRLSGDCQAKEGTARTPSQSPKKRQLTVMNRRPEKKTVEEVQQTATSTDDKLQGLGAIKNFHDFKSLLKQMKDRISLTNYSLFNADVDKNLESLQNLFRECSELQDQVESAHLRATSDKPEPSTPAFLDHSSSDDLHLDDKSKAIQALSQLRRRVNLAAHKEQLAEVNGNPSLLETFLYRLKAEFESNKSEFERISHELFK